MQQRIHARPAILLPRREPARQHAQHTTRRAIATRRHAHPSRDLLVLQLLRSRAQERWRTEQRLEQRHAQRVLIRERPRSLAAELLRRHVLRRAEHRPRACERRVARDRQCVVDGTLVRARIAGAREAEVEHAHAPVAAEDRVVGLEVAMHDPDRVCGRDPATRLDVARDDLRVGRSRAQGPLPQRRAAHELHHDEDASALLTDLEHLRDVVVDDPRHRSRLAAQALASRRPVVRELEQLDRDVAPELLVARREHHTHAAFADALHDGVPADAHRIRRPDETRRDAGRDELDLRLLPGSRRGGVGLARHSLAARARAVCHGAESIHGPHPATLASTLPGEARPSDFDLLTAWAAGDADAAGRLIKRHTGALYRFFDRKVDGAVEDMVQETFVACVERVGHIRPEVGFRAYMFGVARHVLCARLRAQHRQPGELDLESSSLREVGPTPSELVVDAQEEKLLQEALRWLPVETQLLLELYYWQDLTANDLASIYGAAVPAIRSRLRRAKDALRDAVARVAQSPDLLRSTLAELERREPPPPPGE